MQSITLSDFSEILINKELAFDQTESFFKGVLNGSNPDFLLSVSNPQEVTSLLTATAVFAGCSNGNPEQKLVQEGQAFDGLTPEEMLKELHNSLGPHPILKVDPRVGPEKLEGKQGKVFTVKTVVCPFKLGKLLKDTSSFYSLADYYVEQQGSKLLGIRKDLGTHLPILSNFSSKGSFVRETANGEGLEAHVSELDFKTLKNITFPGNSARQGWGMLFLTKVMGHKGPISLYKIAKDEPTLYAETKEYLSSLNLESLVKFMDLWTLPDTGAKLVNDCQVFASAPKNGQYELLSVFTPFSQPFGVLQAIYAVSDEVRKEELSIAIEQQRGLESSLAQLPKKPTKEQKDALKVIKDKVTKLEKEISDSGRPHYQFTKEYLPIGGTQPQNISYGFDNDAQDSQLVFRLPNPKRDVDEALKNRSFFSATLLLSPLRKSTLHYPNLKRLLPSHQEKVMTRFLQTAVLVSLEPFGRLTQLCKSEFYRLLGRENNADIADLKIREMLQTKDSTTVELLTGQLSKKLNGPEIEKALEGLVLTLASEIHSNLKNLFSESGYGDQWFELLRPAVFEQLVTFESAGA